MMAVYTVRMLMLPLYCPGIYVHKQDNFNVLNILNVVIQHRKTYVKF